MKKRIIMIILVMAICLTYYPAYAYGSEGVLPSGTLDTEIGHQIKSYIEEHKDTTASISLAVFRGDETIYETIYGFSNIENQILANDETVYEWGSVSKLLVWVSVMQLWEEGELVLEADIRGYLPEGFLTKLQYDMPITMLNLMNHNAGWEDSVFNMLASDADSVLTLEDALKATEPHQIYEPNSVVSYSNWGVSLAGYIVELISGQPFYQYVQEHIFQPLDMMHSSMSPIYLDNKLVESKLLEAQGYTTELSPIEDGLFYINIYPAGSAAGTLDDFLTFAKALVQNSDGAMKLFNNSETLNEMLSPTLSYVGTDIDYINHGFWSQEFNVQALGHGGNTIMYSSNLMFDPISGVGIVIMTNQGNETVYNYGLPPMVFGQIGQMAMQGERTDPTSFAGLYSSARTIREGIGKMYTLLGLRMFINVDDGNLEAPLFGLAEINLKQIAPNTFVESQRVGELEVDYLTRLGNNAGTKIMSSPYGDILEADVDAWACVIITIFFIIAVIWSIVILISSFIKFLLYKIKKKTPSYDSFKKYQIILCLAILLLLVNIILVANLMFSMDGTTDTIRLHVISSIVLGVIPLVYALLLFNRWNKLKFSSKQKVSYVVTMCAGFIMSLTVIILELYKI
ncbi:MAG: serine hydrolase domain-containing protein [Tissierellaceae bacterium]|nr:serine hydrolase domain-containing protein [Tissierellaceae bacterium]